MSSTCIFHNLLIYRLCCLGYFSSLRHLLKQSIRVSLAAAVQEVIWLERKLSNLKIYSTLKVYIIRGNCVGEDIKYHFVRERGKSKKIDVPPVMMQVDVMTKKLLRPSIENDVDAIGLLEDRQGKC
jgi:hypothetical protein